MTGSISALLGLHQPGKMRTLAVLTGGAFLACGLLLPPAKAVCGGVFLAGLIGASLIDLEQMIIPDLFTIGLAFAGLALSAAVPGLHQAGPPSLFNSLRSEAAALLGLAIGSSLVLWFGLIGEFVLGREILGFGDVKLVGAIGAFCGWQGAVFAVFGGAVVAAIAVALAALPARAASRPAEKIGWGVQFPFGPMLAVAAAAYFVALHPWVDRYLARYLVLF